MISCTAVQSEMRWGCMREWNHKGKHLDAFGHYWGGLPIPVEMRDPVYWRGIALGLAVSSLVVLILRKRGNKI